MPVALAGFFAGVGTLITGAVGLTVGPVAALAIGVTTVVVGGYALRRAPSLLNPEQVARPSAITVVARSTEAPRNIVYGESIVGGVLTYTNVHGPDTQFRALFYEIIHTGHEIDSFVGWRIDDRVVYLADVDDINASPAGNGAVTADTNSHGIGPVGGATVAYLRGWLGTSGQAADNALTTLFPDITSDHRHRGCARTVARFDVIAGAEQVWDGRAPSPPQGIIRGKKVYDPRQDGTLGYSPDGGHRVATPSTWAWSDNPALCLSDYLIDSDLGPGLGTDRIDWASVAAAADVCDALVEVPPAASPANTEKRFTCNLTVDTGMEHAAIIQQILDTMAGRLQYVNGTFRIYAASWETESFDLDDSDLVGDYVWQKQPSTTRGDRYNQVKGTYVDPDRNWQVSAFITVDDTTLRANRDNDRVLTSELSLPGVTGEYQAQRLALLALNQADATGILEFPTGYQGANIRVGDTGTVTLSELNVEAKTFRCVGVRYVDFQGVVLTLREDSSARYDDPTVGDYGTRTGAVISVPRFRRQMFFDGVAMNSDPFFSRVAALWDGNGFSDGDHLAYFWKYVVTDVDHSVSISISGGVTGGVVTLFKHGASAGSANIISLPREPARFITGETVRVSVRIRKTTDPSPAPTNGLIQLSVGAGGYSGVIQQDATGSPFALLDETAVNAWTVNEWQEYSQEFTMQNVAKNLSQYGYVIGTLTSALWDVDMEFEIDAFLITRV